MKTTFVIIILALLCFRLSGQDSVPVVVLSYGNKTLFENRATTDPTRKFLVNLTVDTTELKDLKFNIVYALQGKVTFQLDMELPDVSSEVTAEGELDKKNAIDIPLADMLEFPGVENGDFRIIFYYKDNGFFPERTDLGTVVIKR